jgi:hypothetical protein
MNNLEEIAVKLRTLNDELKENMARKREIIDEISHLIDSSHYTKKEQND